MSVELLLALGGFLVQNGPQFVKDVQALKAAGTATPEQISQLEAQIETMNSQRMESWAAADKALS